MIFLSNRKLKLMIITLLLLIFCFFIGMFRPKAMTQSQYINGCRTGTNNTFVSDEITGSYYSRKALNTSCNEYTPFNNIGNVEGNLIFSFVTWNNNNPTTSITGVEIASDGLYQCDIGSVQTYYDNQTQITIYSANCPVKFNSYGLRNIIFTRTNNTGTTGVTIGELATFVSKDETNVTVNNQEVTNAINNTSTAMQQQIQNQTNSVNDIKDTLKDDSIDTNTATSSASSWNGKNASNGTVTQLLTLPITLLQAIVNGISTSCSSFSLGSLFGTNITLPCINLSNLVGSGLYTTIDILFSGFMILAIGKKLIKIFNDFTNLKSNQIDELYGGGK